MQVVADNNSQAVGIGNITQSDSQVEISLLTERVKHLEEMLAEKERLIKVYERMMEDN
ncbi:hypothetical protein PG1821B_1592 [Bifidobacterium animalis subsp. lactis]|nr:hypothetical protein PG1821B_1592 [Bifidobacterium animalis subsp. lactis]